MKNLILYLLVFLFITACKNSDKSAEPENLIPEQKMVTILVDLSLLSSAKGINKRNLERKGIKPASYVYQKHKIDSLQFAESNTYYSYDIKQYKNIINRVEDSLKSLKIKYKRAVQIAEEKRKKNKKVNNESQFQEKTNSQDLEQ